MNGEENEQGGLMEEQKVQVTIEQQAQEQAQEQLQQPLQQLEEQHQEEPAPGVQDYAQRRSLLSVSCIRRARELHRRRYRDLYDTSAAQKAEQAQQPEEDEKKAERRRKKEVRRCRKEAKKAQKQARLVTGIADVAPDAALLMRRYLAVSQDSLLEEDTVETLAGMELELDSLQKDDFVDKGEVLELEPMLKRLNQLTAIRSLNDQVERWYALNSATRAKLDVLMVQGELYEAYARDLLKRHNLEYTPGEYGQGGILRYVQTDQNPEETRSEMGRLRTLMAIQKSRQADDEAAYAAQEAELMAPEEEKVEADRQAELAAYRKLMGEDFPQVDEMYSERLDAFLDSMKPDHLLLDDNVPPEEQFQNLYTQLDVLRQERVGQDLPMTAWSANGAAAQLKAYAPLRTTLDSLVELVKRNGRLLTAMPREQLDHVELLSLHIQELEQRIRERDDSPVRDLSFDSPETQLRLRRRMGGSLRSARVEDLDPDSLVMDRVKRCAAALHSSQEEAYLWLMDQGYSLEMEERVEKYRQGEEAVGVPPYTQLMKLKHFRQAHYEKTEAELGDAFVDKLSKRWGLTYEQMKRLGGGGGEGAFRTVHDRGDKGICFERALPRLPALMKELSEEELMTLMDDQRYLVEHRGCYRDYRASVDKIQKRIFNFQLTKEERRHTHSSDLDPHKYDLTEEESAILAQADAKLKAALEADPELTRCGEESTRLMVKGLLGFTDWFDKKYGKLPEQLHPVDFLQIVGEDFDIISMAIERAGDLYSACGELMPEEERKHCDEVIWRMFNFWANFHNHLMGREGSYFGWEYPVLAEDVRGMIRTTVGETEGPAMSPEEYEQYRREVRLRYPGAVPDWLKIKED